MLEFRDIVPWKSAEAQHRIVESQHSRIFCVGQDLQRPSSPIPCYEQRYLLLGNIAQSPFQVTCKLQCWGTHSFSGIPVPVSHHSHQKKYLPHAQTNSMIPQFKAIALSLITSYSQNHSKCHMEIQVDYICCSYLLNWCSLYIVEGRMDYPGIICPW